MKLTKNRRIKGIICLLIFSFIASIHSFAQLDRSSSGTEFYVAFGKNNQEAAIVASGTGYNVELLLRITTAEEADVTLSFMDNPALNTTFSVPAGTIKDYPLSKAQATAAYSASPASSSSNMKSIKVTATNPITLVAVTSANRSIEATLVWPVETWGMEYYNIGLDPYAGNPNCDGYIVVAKENNTQVTMTTSLGAQILATLNEGGVYFYYSTGGNTHGTHIVSDKPVALFNSTTQGQVATYTSSSVKSYQYNHNFEQLAPVNQWGKNFILPNNHFNSGLFKIYAKDTPTTITFTYSNGKTGSFTITGQPPNYYTYDLVMEEYSNTISGTSTACYITSDKPVGICAYQKPRISSSQIAAPAVAWLPPMEQLTHNVLVSPLDFSSQHVYQAMDHYLMIIVPTANKSSTTMSLNGDPAQPAESVPNFSWVANNIGNSGYSYGRYYIGESYIVPDKNIFNRLDTRILVDNPDGVIVLAHSGAGSFCTYYYTVGAAKRNLLETYSISGRVRGLTRNTGVAVNYTVEGGAQQSVTTTTRGEYIIEDIPSGSNVVITASEQKGYTAEISPVSTSNVTENITGKDITYRRNAEVSERHAVVLSCTPFSEIDVLTMDDYDCTGNITIEMLDQPKYAESISGLNINKKLQYTPTVNFQGKDNLKFRILCDEDLMDTVLLYVNVIDCLENIIPGNCTGDPEPSVWGIKLRTKTRPGEGTALGDYIAEMDVPLVGDIYGDGNVKILAAITPDAGPKRVNWISDEIAIFDGKTGVYEKKIQVDSFYIASGTRAIAKVKDSVKLFIASGGIERGPRDNYLVCYDLTTGERDWQSNIPYTSCNDSICANILIADMNNDGTPEVIVKDKIYNAATGKLLLDMGAKMGPDFTFGYGAGHAFYAADSTIRSLPYLPAVIDMVNDGKLEFVAGPNIYKIEIPAAANDTTESKIRLLLSAKDVNPGADIDIDGATAVADLNGDGYLDVIVTYSKDDAPYLMAYDGRTGKLFGDAPIMILGAGDPATGLENGPSIPFIGNLDGVRGPEVCVSTKERLHVYTFDHNNNSLTKLTTYKTSDTDGSTTLSMFDFNQDGRMELVYRDEKELLIFNYDSDKNELVDLFAKNEQSICYSAAYNEFPIVADVTGDGHANIVVFGSDSPEDAKEGKGYVYIYEHLPGQEWGPARTVWNQWAYNAVNVNSDLSIPSFQVNPATMFTGGCVVQPYNGFLKQQTLFDRYGCPKWILPNIQWLGEPEFTYANDTIVVSGNLTNIGDAGMMAPIHVTMYKNTVTTDSIIKLEFIDESIQVGDTLAVSFVLEDVSSYSGITSIIIGVNDKGKDLPYRQVCSPSEYKGYGICTFTVNEEDYRVMDGQGYCDKNNFTFEAVYVAKPESIIWKLNGEEIDESRDKSVVNVNLQDGYYTLSMTVPSGVGETTLTTHFYAGKGSVVWTPEANPSASNTQKQRWNNPANWTPAIVPTPCFNVYIPGNSTHYPQLTPASHAVCNSIYFMPGAELGRPDLLTYEKAHVQYNFGLSQVLQAVERDDKNLVLKSNSTCDRMLYSASVSTAQIERERWYMLSSPLKDVVTGDLGFGGFPLTFLKKFGPVIKDKQDYPVGTWTTTYNSMVEQVATNSTNGFAFFMYGYDHTGDDERNQGCEEFGYFNDVKLNDLDYLPNVRSGENYGIEKINGILELPFFADSTSLYAHRTQVYNQESNESTFYYVLDDPSGFNSLTGRRESIKRKSDNSNYRFAPEYYDSNSGDWVFESSIKHPVSDLKAGDYFLAGNPYMSSIDMAAFYNDNTGSVEPEYKIWNGKSFDSFGIDGDGGGIASNPSDNSLFVAPMQGFFLKYKGGDVVFNVRNISTVRQSSPSNLRSARTEVEENILRIKAGNKYASSHAVIGYKTGANNSFVGGEDVKKLFSPFNYVPEIYSLAGDIPVDINFINNQGEVIVPLGIKTEQTGEISLTFTGMDNYFKASKIELIDALENRIVDLTGKSSYTYSFNHTEKGIQNGRFSLRISNSMTALPDVDSFDDIKVYGDSKGLYVISSEPVQKLEVYDLMGRKLYENNSNARYYPLQGNFGNSPLIVKVITKNNIKTVKIN